MRNSHIPAGSADWQKILRLIGVTVPSCDLPARLQCPLCGSARLRIMRDIASGGQWHYCEGCESSGDIVDLAAKAWKLSYAAAYQKLPACGLDPDEMPSCCMYVEMRERQTRAKEVLGQAARNMRDGKGATSKAMLLLRNNSTSWEDWLRGAGKMLGYTYHLDIERIRQPGIRNPGENTYQFRWFAGRSWQDVVVTPFYDLPGRIASLMAFGRKATAVDWVHRSLITPARAMGVRRRCPLEAGISFHPDFKPWRARDTVYAVPGLRAALCLHQKFFRTNANPLPLVSFVSNEKMKSDIGWDMLKYAKVVMWAPRLTGKILWQAYRCNASLAISDIGGVDDDAIVAYLQKSSLNPLLDEWKRRARPWRVALAKFAAENPLEATEEILLGAGLPDDVMAELWQHLPDGLHQQMHPHLFMEQPEPKSQAVESYELRDGKLWLVRGKRSELVCDAVLKVERLVYMGSSSQLQHEGKIEFEGQEYPFATTDALFEKDTLLWMHQFLVAQNAGTMSRAARKHNVLPIFMQLHKPIAMTAVDRIGWNNAANRLDLPHYSISAGGNVRKHRCCLSGEYPAKTWVVPGSIDKSVAQELAKPEFEQFWALASAVIANALQPAWGETRQPIYLEGESIDQRVLEAAGLCQASLKRAGHGWPAFLVTETQTIRHQWLESEKENRNVVLAMSWWGTRLMQLAQPSTIVCVTQLSKAKDVLEYVAPILLPTYLQDLASRNFHLHGGGYRHARVLTDMLLWLRRCGAYVPNAMAAEKHILRPSSEDINHVLGQVFAQLLLERRYALRQSPNDVVKAKFVGHLTEQVTTLPFEILVRAAKMRKAPLPDLANIENAIRRFELEQPATLHEKTIAVPTVWLQRHVTERRGLVTSPSSASAD